MTAGRKGPCRGRPNCPNRAVSRGLCSSCARAYEERRGSAAERGYGSDWRQGIRAQVLLEQPFCAWPGCGDLATEVHHKLPKRQGGTDDRSNLIGYCKHHHSATTMRDSVAGR